jgi:hypothetical protein
MDQCGYSWGRTIAARLGTLAVLLFAALAGCGVVEDRPPPVWRVDPPSAPGKIYLSRPGTYFCGGWQYVLDIRNRGYTRRVVRGALFRDGKAVLPGKRKSVVRTPWGKMRFHDYETHPSRRIGWLPVGRLGRGPDARQRSSPGRANR